VIGAADEHVFGDHAAITLPHSWKPGHTRTYFKEGKWDTCSCDGLGLIVHEGFHVLQYQNIARGWVGIGALNASTILYLACYADHNFDYDKHRAEKAAYKVAGHDDSLYDECCAQIGSLPCDCGCNPASLERRRLAGLQDELLQRRPGVERATGRSSRTARPATGSKISRNGSTRWAARATSRGACAGFPAGSA